MLSSPMHLISLALFAISTLAAPAPASPRTPSRSLRSPSRPSKRVEWLTEFAPALLAGASVELAWTGGSGQGYDLYYIPTWPGAPAELEHVLITRTQGTHMGWTVPSLDAYPADTTLILVVRDVLPPGPSPAPTLGKRSADTGISWFATSRAMRLADKSAFRSAMHARRLLVESEDD